MAPQATQIVDYATGRSDLFWQSTLYAEIEIHWSVGDTAYRLMLLFEGADSYWWIGNAYIDPYFSDGTEGDRINMTSTSDKTLLGEWLQGDLNLANDAGTATVTISGITLRVFE